MAHDACPCKLGRSVAKKVRLSSSLEIKSTIHRGKPTYDLTRPVINLGRDPSNDIVIDEPVVSSFHAQIVREGYSG